MKSQQDEHNNHITTPWSQTANTMATHEHMAKNPMAGHQSANKFTPLSTQMFNKDTPSPKFSGQQNHPPPVNKDTPYLDSAVNQHPLLANKDTPPVYIISFIIYTFIHDMGDCYNIYHYE